MVEPAPIESFPVLSAIPHLRHGFLLRTPRLDVATPEKGEALKRLAPSHEAATAALGLEDYPLVLGEQVHGHVVVSVTAENLPRLTGLPVPGVDGFVTNLRGVALGIHVADCGAVYLVDPVRRALGLVHSGKKGTEQNITGVAIQRMRDEFGSRPEDMIAVLSPCIRPPAYDVDFAAEILRQSARAGLFSASVHDSASCTSRDLERYYSYRVEKGHTGRMLALLAWELTSEQA